MATKVPPGGRPRHPTPHLVDSEQESGYYGAGERACGALHIAHTRPYFRTSDWEHYVDVNEKFADSVVEEIDDEPHPVILIQDYHFTLLPRSAQRAVARPPSSHIPWPNSSRHARGSRLLDGLLGADLIGFHVQAHCNNFLDCIDRFLEARIDREHFSVSRNNHESRVRPFPISVEFDEAPPESATSIVEA